MFYSESIYVPVVFTVDTDIMAHERSQYIHLVVGEVEYLGERSYVFTQSCACHQLRLLEVCSLGQLTQTLRTDQCHVIAIGQREEVWIVL